MSEDFVIGKQRRAIEDEIVANFRKVDFYQHKHAYLEDDVFWDFVFSWYQLVKYYEATTDTAIGAHMLELYQQCRLKFHEAATDNTLKERRRDKANDAIYQMTYYLDRMIRQAERNGIENERDNPTGTINWNDKTQDDNAYKYN